MSTSRTIFLLLVCLFFLIFTISWFTLHNNQPFEDEKQPQFNEDDVVILGGKNFSDFIAKNKHVMVTFYAPWCHWSKRLAPEYAAAATMLKGTEAVLAKVDCTVEVNLGREYKIQGYPTISLFIGGFRRDQYFHDRKRDVIASWVKNETASRVLTLMKTEEAEHVLAAGTLRVVGFFDAFQWQGSDVDELDIVSKLHKDVSFYQTSSADVAKMFGVGIEIKRPALIMLTKTSESSIQFDGQYNRRTISDFVSVNKFPLITTYNGGNPEKIKNDPMKKLWLCANTTDSVKVLPEFEKAAKIFRGKLIFVHVNMDNDIYYYKIAMKFDFGFNTHSPSVVAYDGTTYRKMDGKLTFSCIKSFAEDFLDQKLISRTRPKTDERPQSW